MDEEGTVTSVSQRRILLLQGLMSEANCTGSQRLKAQAGQHKGHCVSPPTGYLYDPAQRVVLTPMSKSSAVHLLSILATARTGGGQAFCRAAVALSHPILGRHAGW
jgi:hypothetical protein